MKTQIMKGASILTVMMMLTMTLSAVVSAAPPPPFTRYGDTTYNATEICSWIDGVEYGAYTTNAGGYLEIDTIGDDTIADTEKTGGVLADTVQYSVGRLTGATGRFFAVAENDAWSPGGTFTGDLTAEAADTTLLKIQIVVSQGTQGVTDYVVLYNGAGAAAPAITGYSLGVGTAAVQAIALSDIPATMTKWNVDPIPAGGYMLINMAKWGGLSNTGNAIRLVYNTHVVDRVEYGTIATSPENTMMSNAGNPGSGQQIQRTGAGTDTNMCAVDFSAPAAEGDITPPVSAVDAISPYWRNAAATITATATDAVGVTSVQLWFRYSADNVTWGAWTNFGTDAASPWSWSFTFASGQGYYQFYTRALDAAANYEAAPAAADRLAGYDNVAPTSACTVAGAYWRNTTPITIDATATDALSGVASVQLYFRYSADNVTFNAWAATGTADTTAPYSFSFAFASGIGYYEFYTRATDRATNLEAAGAAADVRYGYDNVAPTSACDVTGAYWRNTTPITITATATAALSPIASVQFYFRYSADNVTFNAWAATGAPDTTAPYSISFAFASGQGYYQFYTRATDTVGNVETAPAAADVGYGYDNVAPATACVVSGAYIRNAVPFTITATASDATSGFGSVTLYYRYSADNVTFNAYASFGVDTATPWDWSFTGPSGQGYYEFYTRGTDRAGNVENAPAAADVKYRYYVPPTPVLTTMVITTDPVTFDENFVGTVGVSVQGYDQFGAPISCNPTWTDNSAGTTYTGAVAGSPATATLNADGSQIAGGFVITATDGTVSDTATLTITGGVTTTSWTLYNGRNYRTFSSTLTGGWMASNLILDIIATLNADYGESLTNVDVTVTMYDTFLGSFTTCYWDVDFEEWVNDFALAEGQGYIIEIKNLATSPRSYELPNSEISSSVPVAIYNGRNYRGFPVTAETMASGLILDIIAYMSATYGEALTNVDVSLTVYDTFLGSFTTCYWDVDFEEWVNDFALTSTDGYILEVKNLTTSPRMYTP